MLGDWPEQGSVLGQGAEPRDVEWVGVRLLTALLRLAWQKSEDFREKGNEMIKNMNENRE